MPKRLSRQFIVATWGMAAACNGLAMGFGAMPESVAFGRPLDLLVPLNTAPGEALEAACLSAEVEIGERRLPARAVQVVAEPVGAASTLRQLRIQSLQVVDEPVVAISVSAGCRDKITRQFTVFADPVERAGPPPPPMVAALPGNAAPGVMSAQAARTAAGAAPAVDKVSAASAPSPRRKPRARTSGYRAPKAANAVAAAAPSSTPSAARSRSALPATARAKAKAVTPRLQLDRDDTIDTPALAMAAVNVELEHALAGAMAAQAAASASAAAAAQRMALIERDMQQLQAAASVHQATAAQVRARLGAAESQAQWLPLLAALLAVLGGVALWLGGRVRALQRERQDAWAAAVAPSIATGVPEHSMPSAFDGASTAPRALPQAPQWVAAVSAEQAAAAQAAAALALPEAPPQPASPPAKPVAAARAATSARPVSVEELIDLEQQAEFFAVLGQDESAIDLLMVHLRSTGGASPLPYLKLLEIYRRRDDREAYERTRTRFNHRFNAYAPDWDRDPGQGRALLDYEHVMSRLQTAWRTPVDAMAELETLLFRKSSGDLFELPAYRDVLVLYAVARDLNKLAGAAAVDVDVLLPLHADHHGANGEALQLHALALNSAEVRNEDRPTAPVDLDLSDTLSSRESAFSLLTPVTASMRSH